MPQTEITRAYNFPDADLKQKADGLHKTVERDIVKFDSRNINKRSLNEFQRLIDEFANASTDEELLGFCKKATEDKDVAANILKRMLRSVRNMAELAFEGKGHFHTFGFEGMSEMNDNELCVLAKRVIRMSKRFLTELEPQGFSAEKLAAMVSLEAELDTKLDACNEAEESRDIETQDRIVKGNAVYAEMMRLASVGKSIFEDEDEARYNDYVMIGGSSAKADDPKGGKAGEAPATE